MRTSAGMLEAERLQGVFAESVGRCGQSFVVTPSPARSAVGALPRTLFACVEAPNANDIGHLRLEGDVNVDSPVPYVFTFAGTSGVRENDRLVFDGFVYMLLNALPQTYHGVVMGIRCVGVRMRAVE